ncbi:MAG: trypsin-like peptidase domain-containing protein, partial [Myxococcota bacterium]
MEPLDRWWVRIGFGFALLAAVGLGFWLGSAAGSPWPSYSAVFDEVAGSVVNVSVEGSEVHVGSGFVVGPEEVVTARHLVVPSSPADATQVLVRDIRGRTLPAAVVGTDARTDLALLSVPGAGFAPVRWGASAELRVGDTVIAIGNPYGL